MDRTSAQIIAGSSVLKILWSRWYRAFGELAMWVRGADLALDKRGAMYQMLATSSLLTKRDRGQPWES